MPALGDKYNFMQKMQIKDDEKEKKGEAKRNWGVNEHFVNIWRQK